MPELSRRQLLTTASGAGAATMLGGALVASASPLSVSPTPTKSGTNQYAARAGIDDPMNVDLLEHVHQTLVPPPFVPAHDQVASGVPKVVQVRMVIEEKAMVIDDDGTEVQAMTFNGSVPGPLIVVHQGDYVELTLENPESSSLDHNIDFHASTGAMGGGELTHVEPGASSASIVGE